MTSNGEYKPSVGGAVTNRDGQSASIYWTYPRLPSERPGL